MDDATEHQPPRNQPWPKCPAVPCAWGDVFDRLTILTLKCERISDPERRAHAAAEKVAVAEVVGDLGAFPSRLDELCERLAKVNASLWFVEDEIRACERAGRFDDEFIALARAVYQQNDNRAALKREISLLLGSAILEEKSFSTAR